MSIKYDIDIGKGNCNPSPPYVWMAKKATNNLRVYGTTIVAMVLDGIRTNQVLEYDAVEDCWCWVNDWYEGQKDIIFIGSIPLEDVQIDETISE